MNTRFWKAVVASWAVASALLYLVHQIILKSEWDALVARGIVKLDYANPATNLLFGIGIFFGVYIMSEFLEKLPLPSDKRALKLGAQIGALVGLTEAAQFLVYPIPLFMALASFGADVLAFAGAAVVYRSIDGTTARPIDDLGWVRQRGRKEHRPARR